ncbi:MAG: 16S rRNA (guanine(527)-N(7))-methyltransferase RsmG [Clostridiaceae bacterium]
MKETLKRLRPELTSEQLDRFCVYYDLLVDWNSRVNLTAITGLEDVANKHFIDSLAAEPYLKPGARVIDVGTGAGFPGVPLWIVRPDLKLTLLDGLNKRIVFLQTLCEALGLNADCVHLRAEDAGQSPLYREKFDAALTRAVSALPVLAELTLPLVKVGGVSIAYKGDVTDDLESGTNAFQILHATATRIEIPASYGARTLVILQKDAPTPKEYPRKAGTPEKKPL